MGKYTKILISSSEEFSQLFGNKTNSFTTFENYEWEFDIYKDESEKIAKGILHSITIRDKKNKITESISIEINSLIRFFKQIPNSEPFIKILKQIKKEQTY